MDIISGVKRKPKEEAVFFDVRLAGEEQRAITEAKAAGVLLNTLTVAGCFNSFARQQEGYQGAKAFGLKKVKELMTDGTTAEQLSAKIHPRLDQALLIEGGGFLEGWRSQMVETNKVAEMAAMAAAVTPQVAELKARWASIVPEAEAPVVARTTAVESVVAPAARAGRAPAAAPTKTAPFVLARVAAAKAKEAAALAAAVEKAGERVTLAAVAQGVVEEQGRLIGVRWNNWSKKWAAEAAKVDKKALSVYAASRELAGKYVDMVNRCGVGPTATCNFSYTGEPLDPYKGNENARSIVQGSHANMPTRDKLIVQMGIYSKPQLMAYGATGVVQPFKGLITEVGSGKVHMDMLEEYCEKRNRAGATEGRQNAEITEERRAAAMTAYHEILAAEAAVVAGGGSGSDGVDMGRED